jgi:LPXTG-motif cell wall-anchored protein
MVVASTGSFDTAFLVLVGATLIGGVLMIPLMRAH